MAKKGETHNPSGPFRHRSKHRRVTPHASSVRSRRDGGTFALQLGGNQTAFNKRNTGSKKGQVA